MIRLNWMFFHGSHWFQCFDTEKEALDYANQCDLLTMHTVDKVWLSSDSGDVVIRQKPWLNEKS